MPRQCVGSLFLTFLVYPDADIPGDFVAHCLNLDIVATGDTQGSAIDLLKELVEDAVLAALEDGTLEQLCRPAPRKYWAMLATATPYQPSPRTRQRRIKAAPVRRVDYATACG